MDVLPAAPPTGTCETDISAFVLLALWLVPQLIALAISALRVPLWARFPQPGELLALPVLLAAQSATAALLLPILDDWSMAAIVLVSGWPMALIAGSLGATQTGTTAASELYISVWIVALAAWSRVAARWRHIACAVAVCWSIGGAVLLYLRTEFASFNGPLPTALTGPLVASIEISSDSAARSVWLTLLCTAIIGIAIIFSQRVTHPRGSA